MGTHKGAVGILNLNAESYPNSATVYDCPSDAYLADGQKDWARDRSARTRIAQGPITLSHSGSATASKPGCEQQLKQLEDTAE
jgi:hypothetical protein